MVNFPFRLGRIREHSVRSGASRWSVPRPQLGTSAVVSFDYDSHCCGNLAYDVSTWPQTGCGRQSVHTTSEEAGGSAPEYKVFSDFAKFLAAGRVWLSTSDIVQRDFERLVSAGQREGRVTILTGTHGIPQGSLIYELAFFQEDLATWASKHSMLSLLT